jgi:putative flavoprotein involved in K+ transport
MRYQTVVVGAGQAGLSVGYHLKRRGLPFVILEANERIGDTWRRRWDSLRLFTPARYDGLAGMPFPGPDFAFPTKDEMADYLESYAERFELPVRTGVRVERVSRQSGRFLVQTNKESIEADNVIVAMATFQLPKVPAFAKELDPRIVQLHSSEYRNLSQLRAGDVLIVGAGNSGAEIALDIVRDHRIWMSGRDVGSLPFRMAGTASRLVLSRLMLRFVFHRVLTVRTPMGRKVRPKVLHIGGPLIRTRSHDLATAGVERVARVTGVRDGLPLLADDRVLDIANVIWCTGFHPGFSWIDLPVFDDRGLPLHERGIMLQQRGLYFVGLHFLYALSSTMIHGVGRDADRIARAIAARSAKSNGTRSAREVMVGR